MHWQIEMSSFLSLIKKSPKVLQFQLLVSDTKFQMSWRIPTEQSRELGPVLLAMRTFLNFYEKSHLVVIDRILLYPCLPHRGCIGLLLLRCSELLSVIFYPYWPQGETTSFTSIEANPFIVISILLYHSLSIALFHPFELCVAQILTIVLTKLLLLC